MNNKYFLYQRTGGLGDMLLGLYLVWAYSSKFDRKIIVNWKGSTYLRDETNIFSLLFQNNFDILGIYFEEYNSATEYPTPFYPNHIDNEFVRNNWDYKEFFSNGKFIGDKNENFDITKKLITKLIHLEEIKEPTIHSGRQSSLVLHLHDMMKQKITIYYFFNNLIMNYREDIKALIETERKKLFDNDKKYVGIHIRNGNGIPFYYLHDEKKYYPTENLKEYIKISIDAIKESKIEYDKIFLCTDSKKIEDIFMNEYKDNIVLFNRELIEEGTEPHHVYKMNNPQKVMMEAFTEMNLLSYCEDIYSICPGQSSFSVFPSLINKRPKFHRINYE
jgi:hypothetical protein